MSKKKTNMRRREFLQMAAAALPAARYARILGANDRVRVGIVGFSDRFRQALLPAFGKVGKELNFEIVAVSDIWNRRRDEGVAGIEKVTGAKPRPFRNNEEMYDAKATDAVMISTPDFLHAYHGVEAMHAGQDAYIEKPLAHTMEMAVAIRDAVKQSNRVVQIGTQHWFTDLPRPRSVVANGGLYLWKDGRKNWDTATIVFDYGPLNDPTKGFQVVYSSRMTNSAGGTKELYYSNAGMLNLDTNEITPTGGLSEKPAAEMGMKPNQLATAKLSELAPAETAADTGADSSTTANVRNWMECVRTRKKPNADIEAGYNHSVALCMTVAAMHSGRKVMFDDSKRDIVMG